MLATKPHVSSVIFAKSVPDFEPLIIISYTKPQKVWFFVRMQCIYSAVHRVINHIINKYAHFPSV